jgi:hypothetical protein
MAASHRPSFEASTAVSEAFAELSPAAQRVVGLLARLPSRLADQRVRTDVREFLAVCSEAGVDPVGVDRARQVLAAYEGVLGGDETESVRRVA